MDNSPSPLSTVPLEDLTAEDLSYFDNNFEDCDEDCPNVAGNAALPVRIGWSKSRSSASN